MQPEELIIAPLRWEPLLCFIRCLAVELASLDASSALAARFDHATFRSGTYPKQIHHPRRIPNVTALRKDSLFVKLDRDLSQAHSVRAQFGGTYRRCVLIPNRGRSRRKPLSFRR